VNALADMKAAAAELFTKAQLFEQLVGEAGDYTHKGVEACDRAASIAVQDAGLHESTKEEGQLVVQWLQYLAPLLRGFHDVLNANIEPLQHSVMLLVRSKWILRKLLLQ